MRAVAPRPAARPSRRRAPPRRPPAHRRGPAFQLRFHARATIRLPRRPAGRAPPRQHAAAAATISRRREFFAAARGVSGPVRRGAVEVAGPPERRRPPDPGARQLSPALHPHAPLRPSACAARSSSSRPPEPCRRGGAGVYRPRHRRAARRRRRKLPGADLMNADSMVAGDAAHQRLLDSLASALCGGALPGELDDFSDEDCRAAADFIAACAAPPPAGQRPGPARIDRHQARPPADADRHRQ